MAITVREKKRKRAKCKEPTGLQWAVAQAEIDRYLNPEFVCDKGYLRLQKGKTFSARLKSTDQFLDGHPTVRDLGEGYLYRLNYVAGGKLSHEDFFLMVEENLTGMSNLRLFTVTPWLRAMLILIQSHTRRRMPLQRTPYDVSIKSGGVHIRGLAQHDLRNQSVLIFRFFIEPKETNA